MPNRHSAARVSALVGRDDDLAALLRQLASTADGGSVTVTGLPGAGRSALAAAAAAELRSVGTAAVTVPLAGVKDPLGLTDAVLARLPQATGLSTSLPEAMWESYRGAPVLVVLEDPDLVQGLPAVLAELSDRYPAAVLLVTALRPTRAPGERVVRVAPLPLPEADAPADHPALALFAHRAAGRGVEIDLADPVVRSDVAHICREAGGLPGVIELAASRVGAVPSAVMARGLTGTHGLEAALAWSFDLLSKAAQRTLVQVAVFEGPFMLDAAAAVVEPGTSPRDPVEDLLELVDAHLVEIDPAGDGAPRFVLPVLVRGFARRLLEVDDSADGVRDRHAAYFRNRGMAGADVVRREWPDIAAALDHELTHGRLDDALAAAVALAPAVREVPGAAAGVQDLLRDLLDRGEHVSDTLRARALLWSTTAYPEGASSDLQHLGVWTTQRLAEATRLARESGDGPALLEALEQQIHSLRITLDMPAAVSAAYEGLDLAHRLDDQRALARFECWVGMAARAGGDAAESARLAASAVERGREHGDAIAVSSGSQLLLSLPEELRPQLDPPLPDLVELLAECERTDQPFTAMTVLGVLARHSMLGGDPTAAARWLWRLLMIAANRHRSEPLATVGGAAMLMSAALALGDREGAALLRECVRPYELFVPYCVGPPDAVADYQRDVASLDSSVPAQLRQELAAEVAGFGLEQTNRRAQEVARRLAGQRPPERASGPAVLPALTPRERDVLAALASGRTNREIAEDLGMSAKTVMHHSVAIYRKLDVRGRAGASAWAVQHGVAAPEPAGG
jgi:DNA-binding CsgD family transcriptional regulator/predicted ATPase